MPASVIAAGNDYQTRSILEKQAAMKKRAAEHEKEMREQGERQ
jgi:hypothetical protein